MKRLMILIFSALLISTTYAQITSSKTKHDEIVISQNIAVYQLFPTQNMWTFLQLNTRNGRFTLHSTQNIYTFILLDQLDGRTWQVQWALEPRDRFIIQIK